MRNGNKKFHLSWKHGIALLLAVVLLLTMMPSALGSEGGGTTQPEITVVSTVIDGDARTVEVGLSINSGSLLFQSAGVLLKYDPDVLTLIDWDLETPQNVTFNTENAATPVVVPSKGSGKDADKSVGKLAEASVNGGTSYLFLSSEMLKAEAINQALPAADDHSADPTNYPAATTNGKDVTYTDKAENPTDQTVVVRFRVNDGDPETDTPKTLAELVAALDVVGVNAGNIDAVKTFPLSDILASADAVSYFADNADHTVAGITSAAEVAFRWIAKGVTANSGAGGGWAVLFNLMGGKAIIQTNTAADPENDPAVWEDKAADADVTGTLFAAIPGVSEGAEVLLPVQELGENERLVFRMGDGESARDFTSMTFLGTDGNTYTYEDGWEVGAVPENGIALSAQWSADPADFFSIVFYDWCGVEVLGSATVAKVADETEQQRLIDEAMKKFAISLMSDEDAAAYQADGFDPANGTAHPEDGKPLSNKPGYTFGKWIPFDAKYVSSYGGAVQVGFAAYHTTIAEPAGYTFDPADYATGVLVKAAYCSNQDLEAIATDDANPGNRNYTIETVGYTRYSTSENYSVTFKITRENSGNPVPRVRSLGLRVSLTIPGLSIPVLVLQELDNQDEVEAVVAVNSQVTSVSAEVIDLCDDTAMGGSSNWAGEAAARSMATEDATGTGHGEDAGFIILGNVAYINELLRTDAIDTLTGTFLNAAELNYNPAHGQTGTTAGRRLTAVRENLKAMYDSLPADKQAAGLTWEDMQEAIKKGTVWDPALNGGAGGWTNDYDGVTWDGTYLPTT